MKIGFIGAGKVGFTLGKYFVTQGQTVTGYYSQNPQSAYEAARFTNTKPYETCRPLIEDSDTLFLTVPDGAIQTIWDYIKTLPIKGKIICHCSGSLSSAIFSEIESMGAYGYSIHPLFAISNKFESYKEIPNALFTIEGSKDYFDNMQHFLESLGNEVQQIDTNAKTKYHTAAVIVSNQVVALAKLGVDLLMDCGFSEKKAQTALAPLMLGNVKNMISQGISNALTGPIERNDMETIKKHLSCLTETKQELYILLSILLIEIAKDKNPQQDYDLLQTLLTQSLRADV